MKPYLTHLTDRVQIIDISFAWLLLLRAIRGSVSEGSALKRALVCASIGTRGNLKLYSLLVCMCLLESHTSGNDTVYLGLFKRRESSKF